MPNEVPDIYSDFVHIMASDWGIVMALRATGIPALPMEGPPSTAVPVQTGTFQVPTELKAVVRMSHPQAKALAMLLKRVLKAYEQTAGEIIIPMQVVERHQLSAEEW
jgi:hypothetical protein